jgi:cyanophycinase
MTSKKAKTLVIIGGKEDREGDMLVLQEVVQRLGRGKLVVTTVASDESDELFGEYEKAFKDLGVKEIVHLPIDVRKEAKDAEKVDAFDGATGVFFTGGDQLRITSQVGETPTFTRIKKVFEAGGVIAGSSAGAAVMSDTMIVSGNGDESPKQAGVRLVHGLGFLDDVVVNQHFAERGRIGRMVGVVAQKPLCLGLGIDENTAAVVENSDRFRVVGAGPVYVVDGREIMTSNVAEDADGTNLSVYGVKLRLIAPGDGFDLEKRMTIPKGRKTPIQDSQPA